MRAGNCSWQGGNSSWGGNPTPGVKRHRFRKEFFISHKYSRFLRAGRFFFNFFFSLPFVFFHLQNSH